MFPGSKLAEMRRATPETDHASDDDGVHESAIADLRFGVAGPAGRGVDRDSATF